ncbi:hypothetical protein [Radicibacter daui]|uniref:hypothetical protein n=1 Tax=Radicibacter daui TaxID=3064829 RepID=UPI0040468EE7
MKLASTLLPHLTAARLRQGAFALALAATTLSLAPAAMAQVSRAQYDDDSVTLSLSAESWVESATARVTVSINAAFPGAEAGDARARMLAAVETLAKPEDGWRFVQFNRDSDASGLERWSAVAEARLPESALGGLADKATAASKPGMQVAVANTDFTPTPEEMEKARASLRAEIYAKAEKERQTLNDALPGRQFRVATLNFEPETTTRMSHVAMAAAPSAARFNEMADSGVSVATHLNIGAVLVLAEEPADDRPHHGRDKDEKPKTP